LIPISVHQWFDFFPMFHVATFIMCFGFDAFSGPTLLMLWVLRSACRR
jgi:hypothetical protein